MKRPFVPIAIFLSIGIFIAHSFEIPAVYLTLLIVISIILSLVFLRSKTLSHIGLYCVAAFLGMAAYYSANFIPTDHISNMTADDPKKIFVRCTVADDPILGVTAYGTRRMSFVGDVEAVKKGDMWAKATGLVKVDVYGHEKIFNFGDDVALEALISRPNALHNPGMFDYQKYLEIKGIYSVLKVSRNSFVEVIGSSSSNPVKACAYYARKKVRGIFDIYLPRLYSGFLRAILIGDRSELPETLKDDFVKTGTMHIIAISGLNIALIAALFLFIFRIIRIPRRWALLLSMISLIFYSIMAGSSPPVIRAIIIFSFFVIGYLMRRDSDILNSLSAAAFAMLLWNAKELFDPSFQLSFGSVASTIILTPKIETILGLTSHKRASIPEKFKVYLISGVSVSIAAWIGVAPIISFYFNIISPVALISNLVVIPILFVLTVLSFVFLFLAFTLPFAAAWMSTLLYIVEKSLFIINHKFALLPFAYFRVPAPSAGLVFLYYTLILILFMPVEVTLKKVVIRKKHALMAILFAFTLYAWSWGLADRKKMDLTFFDVGQGDAAFMKFPDGHTILIDGGSGGFDEKFDMGKGVIAPYLWNRSIRKIDLVMVTHFHEDHIGGIPYILDNFNVGCVVDNGATIEAYLPAYNAYQRIIKKKKIKHLIAKEGYEIVFPGGPDLFVLNPIVEGEIADSNDNSMVAKITYKDLNILFCADISTKVMERLNHYGDFLRSDVIKIPHHGGSVGEKYILRDFIELVSPRFAVISVGRVNRYRAPAKSTLDVIDSLSIAEYETKNCGAIMVNGDGKSFEVKTTVRNKSL